MLLLDRFDHSLAQRGDNLLSSLSEGLMEHTSPETHPAVIELATGIHTTAPEAAAELSRLRARLALELRARDVIPACAGMHPMGSPEITKVSDGERYRVIAESLGFLARREPTLALHVHIGVPDPEDAIRLLNRLRENVPLLLALSANSPFFQGRDSGFLSARTAIFGGFPGRAPRARSPATQTTSGPSTR